ncbi:MAG: hypothetical protein WCI18_12945 [Pseudomonadota bacterium]
MKCKYIILLLLPFAATARADFQLEPLTIELKVGADLPLARACKAITPLLTESGPWQFKIASQVNCSTNSSDLPNSKNEDAIRWEMQLNYESPVFTMKLCRNIEVDQGQKRQVCEAETSATLKSDKQLYGIFDNEPLMRALLASIYDQLPFKSIANPQNSQIGTETEKSSRLPQKYGDLFDAEVFLTPDAKYFKIAKANDSANSKNWLIHNGEKGLYKERIRKLINQITKKMPVPAENSKVLIEPPLFKVSGLISLFPDTSRKSAPRPPTIFEARFRALVEKPIFGFKPLFEIGKRETTSFIDTAISENSGSADEGNSENQIVEEKDSRAYYLIGTAFKFYIYGLYFEPSIAAGVSYATVSIEYPDDTTLGSRQKYVASSTRIGFSSYFHLFKIDAIGEISAAGSLFFSGAKSKAYQQASVTLSTGGTLLLRRKLIPKWSNLTDVSLEASGEFTQQNTTKTFDTAESSLENSNSLLLITAVFGISGYWY